MTEVKKQFILMRGLPGSGKSTKAKDLAGELGQVLSTDDYFYINEEGEYRFDGNQLGTAHAWNQRRALEAVKKNIPVIVIDNTNTTLRDLRSYIPHIELAKKMGYEISIQEPDTDWQFTVNELVARGTHNVPQAHIEKMLRRYVMDVTVEDILAPK